MKNGDLKKETEGLITAAQDQALWPNAVKASIEGADVSPMCRMCGEREETVFHLACECCKMAQTDYKGRQDKLARVIHPDLCRERGIAVKEKWWEHVPEKVLETDDVKVLWDFNIQTDCVMGH